jgi:hypothetical protein
LQVLKKLRFNYPQCTRVRKVDFLCLDASFLTRKHLGGKAKTRPFPFSDGGQQQDALRLAAIDLLNRRGDEFRPKQVLEILPDGWSLSAIAPALTKMTRASLHKVSTPYFQDHMIHIVYSICISFYLEPS